MQPFGGILQEGLDQGPKPGFLTSDVDAARNPFVIPSYTNGNVFNLVIARSPIMTDGAFSKTCFPGDPRINRFLERMEIRAKGKIDTN